MYYFLQLREKSGERFAIGEIEFISIASDEESRRFSSYFDKEVR